MAGQLDELVTDINIHRYPSATHPPPFASPFIAAYPTPQSAIGMSAEADFGVDSYHLNVGSGDCAIHLKVKLSNTAKPTCLAAVLIDGGEASRYKEITLLIRRTIKELEENYTFPDYQGRPNTKLRFDAIVITHWHVDHVDGIFQLVREDIASQGTPSQPVDVTFIKYNKTATGRIPQTVMYFPYWEKAGFRGGRQAKYEVDKNRTDPTHLDFKDLTNPKLWWRDICLVEHESPGLLGVNFFSNKGINGAIINTPGELLSKNPPEDGHPAMYCIAHDGHGFPNPKVDLRVIKEIDIKENLTCIAAIVMWKSAPASIGRISYYTAGDLPEVNGEDKIVEWLKDYRVVSMKASHHGARQSFPAEIITGNWKPKTIIISCGEKVKERPRDPGNYCHPRWELILWLEVALRAEGMIDKTKVFCTCYPYYFTWSIVDGYPDFSMDALALSSPIFADYRKSLIELHGKLTALPATEQSIPAEYEKYVTDTRPNAAAKRAWVVRKASSAWQKMCDLPDSAQAFFGAKSSTEATMTQSTNVQYVVVRSRSDEDKDGHAMAKFFGDPLAKGKGGQSETKPQPKPADNTAKASKPSAATSSFKNAEKQLPGPTRPASGRGKKKVSQEDATWASSTTDHTATISTAAAVAHPALYSVDDSDERFYIYAHDVSPPEPKVYVVTEEHQIAFIEMVHRQVIVLETSLPSEALGTVKLDASDEMYAWLQDSLGATLSARGMDPDIQHFSLEMAVIGQNLHFDTAATVLQFKLDDINTRVGTWGLLSGYNVMVLGLLSELSGVLLGDVFNQVLEMDLPILLAGLARLSLHIAPADIEIPNSLYQRNAIWFVPGDNYTTVLRLQLHVSDVASLNAVLAPLLGGESSFSITAAQLMVKKTMWWSLEQAGLFVRADTEAIFVGTAKINGNMSLDFSFSFADGAGWGAALMWNEDAPGFDDILTWLASLVNVSLDFNEWIPESVRGPAPRFRRVEVFGTPERTIAGFRVDFECQLNFGGEDNEVTLVFLSYSWPSNTLSGSLWQKPPESDLPDLPGILCPTFESVSYIPLPDIPNITDRLSLSKLFPNNAINGIPEQIFPYVDFASLTVSPTGITFTGGLIWEADETSSTVPIADLGTMVLYAFYDWTDKTFELSLDVSVTLPLAPSSQSLKYPEAILMGAIAYSNQTWMFHAGVYGLNIGALYEFFDSDSRDGVVDMLEAMEIEELSMDGTYSAGKLTLLEVTGVADLKYTYEPSGWSVEIGLGEREASATVGDIVGSILGTNFVLPACVSSITVSKTPESKIFSISIYNIDDPTGKFLIFEGNFQVNGLGFSFVQMKKYGLNQFTKRVVKVAVSQLPTATVPLVGDMPQPFDELAFLWVDDASTTAGLTRAEVLLLNTHLFPDEPGIRFKEPKQVGKQNSDVVVKAGLHFLVTLNIRGESTVILDHRFGSTKNSTDPRQLALVTTTGEAGQAPNTSTSTTQGDSEVTEAPIGRTFGALTLRNIGLQYKNDTLYIIFDASFQLGPLMMELIGFGIGVGFDGIHNLQNLPSSLSVTLQGLAVGFDKPPIVMNGLFQYTNTADLELYSGALTVSFRPYTFMAAGFYGTASNTLLIADPYKTVFIFARLAGPLVRLEFAEISGICGGFGYNNTVRQPSVQEVVIFPFIGGNIDAAENPLEALRELTTPGPGGWVTPRPDTFWLAAGLDVKAMSLVSIDAVIVAEFNPYVKLGIYAVCRGSLPPNSIPSKSFLFIEFGILASIDFEAGIFKVEGQLSPNSFILASSCHIQGGFALFYWFNGSEYDGDWVFSVGGYHPAYTPFPHYPRPPRLGISWTIGGGISIQGLSYFAITPKCCMAGGELHLALSLGPLSAWLDAGTNFLINYNPFYFMADVYISVGVAFTLDLWIVTIRIKIEIGARLELSGPPFQGLVHVDFWVFGFDIRFGAESKTPEAATLDEFWQLLLQQGVPEKRKTTFAMKRRLQGVSGNSEGKVTADAGKDHVFAIDSGLVPSSENKEDNSLWIVRGGILVFMEATKGPNTPFYAKPMKLTEAISSIMLIDKWRIEPIIKSVPVAIWGKYSSATDPQMSGNNIDALLDASGATMQLMMGASIRAPLPTISPDNIPKFNLVHAMSQDVYPSGLNPPFPPTPPEQNPEWSPAAPTSDQYDNVKEQWANPTEGRDAGTIVFALWAEAFKWAEKDTVGMTGALPLVAVERLGQIYMSPPLLSSG
ncbi:hypothetical protein JB92DRAFT_2931985 [Gautieria morchelliformis]|nr:hypothetical protein JB92DRAFT_2931985 [Gautieria morchelliformis]